MAVDFKELVETVEDLILFHPDVREWLDETTAEKMSKFKDMLRYDGHEINKIPGSVWEEIEAVTEQEAVSQLLAAVIRGK